MNELPSVSILTPTFNRRLFIPQLLRYFGYQTYPAEKLELVIYDDGTDPISDLVEGRDRVRYHRADKKMTLGQKRNFLNDNSTGEILVCMDDDDYYPPDRVEHAVTELMKSEKLIAGCSGILIYYLDLGFFIKNGPFSQNHAINSTMAYKREYLNGNRYDDAVNCGEEPSFTNKFSNPMVQLDVRKTVLLISHSSNTFDKRKLLMPNVRVSNMPLSNFIPDEKDRDFYFGMGKALKDQK
jgi:glycosyltransferase involved in cell wall biosynthesis